MTHIAIASSNTSIVYASGDVGMFRSQDGGVTWAPVNNGFSFLPVNDIAVDPTSSATVYAGTNGQGLFKTLDGGANWAAVGFGLPTDSVINAIVIDPFSPATLYAGVYLQIGNGGTGQGEGGVFKSTDAGETWAALQNGFPNKGASSIAIDPAAPGTLYAATAGAGIFKTTDGGAAWMPMNAGLDNYVVGVTIDPTNPATLYAGTVVAGVFKTTDAGASWSKSDTGITNPTGIRTIAVDPIAGGTVYAVTYLGIFKSTDGGLIWARSNTGIDPSANATTLAIHPSSPSTLIAGTDVGAFKSINGGGIWSPSTKGLSARDIRSIVMDHSGATVYAADYRGRVFKSTDRGQSWASAGSGLEGLQIFALAIDPSSPVTLYAAAFDALDAGVYKTTDGGATWRVAVATGRSAVFSVEIDPANPTTVYAGTGSSNSSYVIKSTDGGQSWIMGGPVGLGGGVRALAIDPTNTATIYAGTFGGALKSTDAGTTWTPINTGLASLHVNSVAVNPNFPSTIYAGTGAGVFKSLNAGANWAPMNTGLATLFVTSVVIDPSSPETVYAGTGSFSIPASGIYRSLNGGKAWTPLNAGLTNQDVNVLLIDPSSPNRLYAGTRGGVYDYTTIAQCVGSATILCLNNGAYRVTSRWQTRDGRSGYGQAVAVGGDSGYFTFFSPANVEVLVKVLNGCAINGRFWVFAGGLTDVNVVMTVTAIATGETKTYVNGQGTPFQPLQDTEAFSCADTSSLSEPLKASTAGEARPELKPSPPSEAVTTTAILRPSATCVANATTLCLNAGRFQVRAEWLTSKGASGSGQAINLTSDTGAFWFFSASNVEIAIKIVDGRPVNSRFWIFAGGLTNVQVVINVIDMQTGAVRTYTTSEGVAFPPIQDTTAF